MAAERRFFNRNMDPYLTTHNVTEIKIDKKFLNPVGQIVEIGDRNEIINRFCSGFNINGGKYFLTAGHCISDTCFSDYQNGPIPGKNCAVSFGYEAHSMEIDGRMYDVCVPEYVFRINETVSHGYCKPAQTDYGVLKLAPGAEKWGSLDFADYSPNVGHPVFILHHPKGISKRCSTGKITQCAPDYSTFIYNAATHGGSSGAPVLSNKDGTVLGVHVTGNETTQQRNSAVSISAILASTRRSHYSFFGYSDPSGNPADIDNCSVNPHESPQETSSRLCSESKQSQKC